MRANAILFGWNRSIPGREQQSAQHFQEFVQYLTGLEQRRDITSFETVFLDSHGGDLNGFVLIRGDPTKLDDLAGSTEWITHMTRAVVHLEGAGAIRAATGGVVMERMQVWTKLLPS